MKARPALLDTAGRAVAGNACAGVPDEYAGPRLPSAEAYFCIWVSQ